MGRATFFGTPLSLNITLLNFHNRAETQPWRNATSASHSQSECSAGRVWDERHIRMQPLCKRLELNVDTYVTIIEDLVDALHLAAIARYVHRDVRPANIMLSATECTCDAWPRSHHPAVLLDWGFALEVEEGNTCSQRTAYSGTVSCASQRILKLLQQGTKYIKSGFADDAESLVKAVWRLLVDVSPPKELMKDEEKGSINKEIAAWWFEYWEKLARDIKLVGDAFLAAQTCAPTSEDSFDDFKKALKMVGMIKGYNI